jgi:hypothetical protein
MTQPMQASSTIQEAESVVIKTMAEQLLHADQLRETLESKSSQATTEGIFLAFARDAGRAPRDSPTTASSDCVRPAYARDGPARPGLRGRIGQRWVL